MTKHRISKESAEELKDKFIKVVNYPRWYYSEISEIIDSMIEQPIKHKWDVGDKVYWNGKGNMVAGAVVNEQDVTVIGVNHALPSHYFYHIENEEGMVMWVSEESLSGIEEATEPEVEEEPLVTMPDGIWLPSSVEDEDGTKWTAECNNLGRITIYINNNALAPVSFIMMDKHNKAMKRMCKALDIPIKPFKEE